MRYYEPVINRIDKDGARIERHQSKDKDILKAGDAGMYCESTDINAYEVGYLGVDDIDRIRRENLRHKTR
jgi:hypothetical protein